jgi:O-acetyl-ADP-ribose deacetylase (regulator of RNase III)
MIEFKTGDLFQSDCVAFVNTVNCVGAMGKGIALEFKKRFPEMFEDYKIACSAGRVQTGKIHVVQRLFHPRWILNFPTKNHWRNPSKLEWVRTGLWDLFWAIKEEGIESIAIPPLGCGNGGLNWQEVKPLIAEILGPLKNIRIDVFEPWKN